MTEHTTTDAAIATLRAAPADTGRLRDRLARDAEREGLVDVVYRTVDSPIGGLLLAATPLGLVYVAFAGSVVACSVMARPPVTAMGTATGRESEPGSGSG